MRSIKNKGFTLLELMLVLAITAGLMAIALPSFNGYAERNRLKAAAEGLSSDLHYARSEAIMRGAIMTMSFTTDGSADWCYGTTITPDPNSLTSCNCTITDPNDINACAIDIAGAKVLRVVDADNFQGSVSMPTVTMGSNMASFTPVRALGDTGTVSLTAKGQQVDVNLTAVGRVRICSDAQILGYPSC